MNVGVNTYTSHFFVKYIFFESHGCPLSFESAIKVVDSINMRYPRHLSHVHARSSRQRNRARHSATTVETASRKIENTKGTAKRLVPGTMCIDRRATDFPQSQRSWRAVPRETLSKAGPALDVSTIETLHRHRRSEHVGGSRDNHRNAWLE